MASSDSPPPKKQRTTGSTSGSEDLQKALQEPEQEEVEGDDHLGNIQAEESDDQIVQGDTNEQRDDDLKHLLCDEDPQKAFQEAAQVEVEGAHLDNIQVYIRKQLPALHVTSLDAVARASIVESMLTTTRDAQAAHLATQIFDRYYSEVVDPLNALPAVTVSSTSLTLAMKRLHPGAKASTQTTLGNEVQVLNVLKYHLNAPTLKKLVDACVQAITPLDTKLKRLCEYLTDLAMLDRDCTRYQITILAAACLFFAQSIMYPAKVHEIRGLWKCDSLLLEEAVTILRDLYLRNRLPQCHDIRDVYSTPAWRDVVNFPCPATILDVVDF